MPNEFGELIRELKLLQDRPAVEPLRKSLPARGELLQVPVPRAGDMKHLAARLDMMTKSLAAENAAAAQRKHNKREEFLKSLTTLNDRISAQITAGKLTAHEACVLTAKLHHLGDRAHALLAAGGR